MNNKERKVKIKWNDVSVFSPRKKEIALSPMETIGLIERDEEDYLIVKNPKTTNLLTNKKHPERDPYFYFIPKGMIERVDFID